MATIKLYSNSPMLTDAQRAEYLDRVEKYRAGAQAIIDKHFAEHLTNLVPDRLEVQHGQRFTKVIKKDRVKAVDGTISERGGSIHSFLDRLTGDVLKPASYKAPAKHARGNLYDEHFGTGTLSSYGPAYLK